MMSQNLGTWRCLLGHLLPVTQGGLFTTWGKYGKEWGPERTLVSNGEAAAQQLPKGRAWGGPGLLPHPTPQMQGLPPPQTLSRSCGLPLTVPQAPLAQVCKLWAGPGLLHCMVLAPGGHLLPFSRCKN